MNIVLPSARTRISQVPFLFRAADCIDENGIYALSYGKRVAGVFTRSSPKTIVDQRGQLVRIPNGAVLPSVVGGQVSALLEPASENLCIRSEEFDTWSRSAGVSVTVDAIAAPDGTTTADLITDGGALAANQINRVVTATGDGEKCMSLYVKAGTAAQTQVGWRDATVAAWRHLVTVTWSAGVPTLSTFTGAGTLYPVEALANGWYRILFSATGVVAANTNTFFIYPTGSASAVAGTVYAWGAQAENAVVPSSYIKTEGSTVTRNADVLYFDVPALNPPRAMSFYLRGVDRGRPNAASGDSCLLFVGTNESLTDPRWAIFRNTIGGGYQAVHDDGAGISSTAAVGGTAVRGDLIALRGVLGASGTARLGVSINGAAESVSAEASGATLQGAWAGTRLYVNQFGGGLHTQFAYTHVLIAEGVRTMDELRALAGVG